MLDQVIVNFIQIVPKLVHSHRRLGIHITSYNIVGLNKHLAGHWELAFVFTDHEKSTGVGGLFGEHLLTQSNNFFFVSGIWS